MGYWRAYRTRGTMREYNIRHEHKKLIDSVGAYWRPYSFYKGMNNFSDKPAGRDKSVHIQRRGLVRTQHKTLCGLTIFEQVENFNYDDPNLCKACRKVDLAVEQQLLNRLSVLAAGNIKVGPRVYVRDSHGRFSGKKRKVRR